jgi:hypothetical protein
MTRHAVSTDHDFDDVDPDGFAHEATTAPGRAGPESAATTMSPGSCASPLSGAQGQPGGTGAPDGVGPSADEPAGDPVPTVFTPAQAAEVLQVPES